MERKKINSTTDLELHYKNSSKAAAEKLKADRLTTGSEIRFENKIQESLSLKGFDFTDKVIFHSRDSNLTLIDCTFEKGVSFADAHIRGKLRFRNCSFNEKVNFDNTSFHELADFWKCTFVKRTIFYKTDFYKIAVFSTATFKENVLFTYTLIDKLILFRGTQFVKGLDLSTSIINGNIGAFDFNLKDFEVVHLKQEEGEKGRKKFETDYENAIFDTGDIPIQNKRDTFRIIKSNLETQKNYLNAIEYNVLEKSTLKTEYEKGLLKEAPGKIWVDRKILLLNEVSNGFGKSPEKGFVFVAGIGFLFFLLQIATNLRFEIDVFCDLHNWDRFFSGYFASLNPTHKINYLGEELFNNRIRSKSAFVLIDTIGRLFIGYGIYQTIQAFRKFR